MSAIYILWLRQVKRSLRARARLLGTFGQPLMFLLAVGFGFGPIFRKAQGSSYIQFLSPGLVAMGILFTAVFSGMELIWDRQFGFLKETLVAPVSRVNIVIGRILGGATVAVFQGAAVLLACLIAGFRPSSAAHLPSALLVMLLIAILFAGIGTAIASLVNDMQSFPLIMNFLIVPLFFFSNALFPVQGAPRLLRLVVRLNPVTYGVDGLRGAFEGGLRMGLGTDLAVLGGLTVLMVAIASWLFSKIRI